MRQYKVIAGAVPAIHSRNPVRMGDMLNEDSFDSLDEIATLIKEGFIEELPEELPEEAATLEIDDTGDADKPKKKKP